MLHFWIIKILILVVCSLKPEPVFRIHDILVWIRNLLFSSLTFKMPAKNKFFNTIFSACYFLKVHWHYLSKIKSQRESQNRIQGFSYYFCMIIEGSGSRAGSGSIRLWLVDPDPGGQKTRGSGSVFGSGSGTLFETLGFSKFLVYHKIVFWSGLSWLTTKKKLHAVFSGLECRCQRKEWRISGQDTWWRNGEKKII